MQALYFVSYEVRSINIQAVDMCQMTLEKPIRSFGDVLNMAEIIANDYKQKIGDCIVTILNYKRLEEAMEIPQQPKVEGKGVEQ